MTYSSTRKQAKHQSWYYYTSVQPLTLLKINYLLTESEVIAGNIKLRLWRIDRAIALNLRLRLVSCLFYGILVCKESVLPLQARYIIEKLCQQMVKLRSW